MKFIGILMINGENDILERTLAHNARLVDFFYVLDGTYPHETSRDICLSHDKCHGYKTDDEVPYAGQPRDGWRQHLYEQAVADHGYDNWFLLLHGDEVWTANPRDIVDGQADCYQFPLPFYFPRTGEEWDDDVHPLDQLHWRLGPGYPEWRLFRGAPDVHYEPRQHFNVLPEGLKRAGFSSESILHYPYRSPVVQRQRAVIHERTGFDPDNYRHILDDDAVYWTDDMIAAYQRKEWFRNLDCRVTALS